MAFRTMNNSKQDVFFDQARERTKLRIDGIDVNPMEISVDVESGAFEGTPSQFEMEMDVVSLLHELTEAEIAVETDRISEFVEKDLAMHPQEALSAYLGIIQGILCTKSARSWRNLFSKSEPTSVKWRLIRVEKVLLVGERLAIHGRAEPSTSGLEN